MKHAGSPPHTREPPHSDRIPQLQAGITPAYAGTTYCNNLICCIRQDHPRIRGNHERKYLSAVIRPGSPPHTREPPEGPPGQGPDPGITPAYAGTTVLLAFGRAVHEDHPRIRGNHISIAFWSRSVSGSPPHTREPRLSTFSASHLHRITPAYAGTTILFAIGQAVHEDHPRIRGNHSTTKAKEACG